MKERAAEILHRLQALVSEWRMKLGGKAQLPKDRVRARIAEVQRNLEWRKGSRLRARPSAWFASVRDWLPAWRTSVKDQSQRLIDYLRGRLAAARAGLGPWRDQVADQVQRLGERGREQWAMARDRWSRMREPETETGVPVEGAVAHLFEARDYPRSRNRHYLVHVPSDYDGNSPLPLVMVLHGCRQTHRDIRRISRFDAVADKFGFIAVYPFVTSYGGLRFRNCWGFWNPGETNAGAGEAEDLWQIVEEVRSRYQVDARRIHVAGLSSGAGMTAALLVAYAGRFASGAVVAGVPYSESSGAVNFLGNTVSRLKPVYKVSKAMRQALPAHSRPVPLMIVHSHDDATVDIQAAHNLRDSWGHCFGIDTLNATRARSGVTRGTPWEHKHYGRAGASLIETFFVGGKGHGWYGGHPGPYSYPDAPDISRRIWLFFDRHPL